MDLHVLKLERFVAFAEVGIFGLLLECLDCQIAFHGYHAGTVVFLASNRELKSKLAQGVPSICMLSVGGNVFDHAEPLQTLLTCHRMYECAQEWANMGVKSVVVCQVVRRQSWRPKMYEDASAIVTEITDF